MKTINELKWEDSGLLHGLKYEDAIHLDNALSDINDYLLNMTGIRYHQDDKVETVIFATARRIFDQFIDQGVDPKKIEEQLDGETLFTGLRKAIADMPKDSWRNRLSIDYEAEIVMEFAKKYCDERN